MKRLGVVVAISLIGACIGLFVSEKHQRAEIVHLQQSVEGLAATTEQAARTQGVGTTQLERVVLSSAIQAIASSQQNSQPNPPPTTAAPARTPAEMRSELQSAFDQDSLHGAWTSTRQRAAVEALTAALPGGSSLRSLECRESMCSLETEHPDGPHFQSFWHSAFGTAHHVSIDGPSSTIRVNDGASRDEPGTWVTYVAIDGHALPLN